jgi:hypothetical protein
MADNEDIMPEPDYITNLQSYADKICGRPLSNPEILDTFVLSGPGRRIEVLRQLDFEDAAVSIGVDGLHAAADRMELKKKLNDLHRTMLRARR